MGKPSRCVPLVIGLLLLGSACVPGGSSKAPPPGAPATPAEGPAGDAPGHDAAADLYAMSRCAPAEPPVGAVPPSAPAWCGPLAPGANTAVTGANSWTDGFDGGQDHAALPASYRVFEAARSSNVFRTRHFMHNGHWMVDIAGRGDPPGQYEGDPRDAQTGDNWGGGMLSPEKSFRFEGGRLVVRFDAAAGTQAYNDAWPEIIVTTAAAPTGVQTDPIHAIGVFGGAPAVGCRLYNDRTSNCSAFDGSGRAIDEGGRVFELSAGRSEGAASAMGGSPTTAPDPSAWRVCASGEPDSACRDRFTVEFTRDSVRLWVNGTLYMAHTGLPPEKQVPQTLLTSDVYVYFASWVYIAQPESERLHWGRIAIGPHLTPTD